MTTSFQGGPASMEPWQGELGLVASPISGASMNPARTLGPDIVGAAEGSVQARLCA